jgi:predicted ATPase
LEQLVNKSLVESAAGATMRYRLLETIRQYVQEKLDGMGEISEVCDRHLAFYRDLAELAAPRLMGPEQSAWFA